MGKTSINILESVLASRLTVSDGGEIAVIVPSGRGRADKVYTVESSEQFTEIFGAASSASELAFSYCKYLLDRGNILKVVRTAPSVTSGTAVKASGKIYKDGAVTGTSYFNLEAVAAGTSYNGIVCTIAKLRDELPLLFSLTLSETVGTDTVVLEKFAKVSLDPNSVYYWGNLTSQYVDFSAVGITVSDTLFAGQSSTNTCTLAGGTGDVAVDDLSYKNAADLLKNRDEMFATLIVPGKDIEACLATHTISDVEYAPIIKGLLDYRNDFVYLPEWSASVTTSSAAITEASNYKSSYVTTSYPDVRISALGGKVPACVAKADLIGSLHRRRLWFKAPAGTINGVAKDASDVTQDLNETEIGNLQEAHVNPVIVRPGIGVTFWGQDLLASASDDITVEAVRLLVNYLKRSIYTISQGYLFRENNEFTWTDWTGEVEPLVRDIYNLGGIQNYRVTCDRTTMSEAQIQNGIMRAEVVIQPVGYITKINVAFTIDQSGVSFEE